MIPRPLPLPRDPWPRRPLRDPPSASYAARSPVPFRSSVRTKDSFAEAAGKDSFAEAVDKDSSAKAADKDSSAEATDKDSPAEAADKDSFVEATVKDSSAKAASGFLARDLPRLPREHGSLKKHLPQEVGRLSQETCVDALPALLL